MCDIDIEKLKIYLRTREVTLSFHCVLSQKVLRDLSSDCKLFSDLMMLQGNGVERDCEKLRERLIRIEMMKGCTARQILQRLQRHLISALRYL